MNKNIVAKKNWTVADAKAKFSEVINRARDEPQTITRNGQPSVVVVSVEEWARKTERKGSLAAFLMSSPLQGAQIDIDRLHDQPTDIDL